MSKSSFTCRGFWANVMLRFPETNQWQEVSWVSSFQLYNSHYSWKNAESNPQKLQNGVWFHSGCDVLWSDISLNPHESCFGMTCFNLFHIKQEITSLCLINIITKTYNSRLINRHQSWIRLIAFSVRSNGILMCIKLIRELVLWEDVPVIY